MKGSRASVTAAQLRQMVPHDGKVVTMRLQGAAVIEVLEQAVESCYTTLPGRIRRLRELKP